MLREMSTRYGRTPGGYIWAVLEPLAAIIFLSVGFSLVLRTPSLGNSFLLFYATGYLPFNLYMQLSNMTGRALNYSKPLLKYPAVTWIDAILARFALNTITNLLIGFLLLTGILLGIDSRAQLFAPPLLEAAMLTMMFGLGVGVMNAVLMGLFPIWDIIWSVLSRPLFLASGVLYTYEDLPRAAQDLLWYNPLLHIVGLFRSGVYPNYQPAYVNPLFVLFVSLALLGLGLLLMRRYHRVILNR